MKKMVFCMGVECPVRNTCKRYTTHNQAPIIRKCSNQRRYLQDRSKVNEDSSRR